MSTIGAAVSHFRANPDRDAAALSGFSCHSTLYSLTVWTDTSSNLSPIAPLEHGVAIRAWMRLLSI